MAKDILYPLRLLHGRIHEYVIFHRTKRHLKKYHKKLLKDHFKNNAKSVILVLTPEHTNLGDHAIALAETEMLDSINISYVEITGAKLDELKKFGLLDVMNGYPILINGGGNLGTLWFGAEQLMRDIITNNPKSAIMILPNTIHYDESLWGKGELEASERIYNSHDSLYIYAREKISYDFMKTVYRNVKIIPDVVLSLNKTSTNIVRNGCLLCLRNDCEKTLSAEDDSIIKEQIESIFKNNYKYIDTHAAENVAIENRTAELEKKFFEFSSAELVVTDRLHGMIFAAITGTPCIVINSKSPKVKGCYEWIKDLDYIRFADDISQIGEMHKSMPKGEHRYDNKHLKLYFEELKQDIVNIVKGE